ncbi:MAG: hypothetical protein Q9224_004529 [Gallowayella concinna]
MPSPKRHSPRAAIREWLSHTAETDPHEYKDSANFPEKKKNERLTRTPPPPTYLNHSFSSAWPGKKPPRVPDECADPPQRRTGDHPTQLKDGRNIAEQLGLHAPFRSIATRGMDLQHDSELEGQRHKRKRKPSSSPLYLEPAVQTETAQDPTVVESGKRGRKRQQDNVDISSHASTTTVDSPAKPAKTYEKRSRHKTRVDRYDLEKDKKPAPTRESEKKGRIKSKKGRKCVQKSGAALMQDFSAKNVETDRLTRQHAVPDLTFSEVKFLNHHRGNQEDDPRSNARSKRRKEDKAADAEATFSRFFATPRDSTREADNTLKHKEAKGKMHAVEKTKSHERSSLPPIELPEKPFLGFGSCGPGHVSPVVLRTNTISDDYKRRSPMRKSLSDRSTTYFTWSHSSPSRYIAPRPPSGNQATSHQGRNSRASKDRRLSRGFDRNKYQISRTPSIKPSEPRNSPEDHGSIHHSTPVPVTMHGHSGKSPVRETRMEVIDRRPPEQRQEKIHTSQRQRSPQTNNNVSTSTDLASLLAKQHRPELLGAVLDLLLGKVKSYDSGPSGSTKPSQCTDSRGKDHVPVPEAIFRAQQPNEASANEKGDSLCLNPNIANHTESLAWISDSQRLQSFDSDEVKVRARHAVPDLQIPRSISEKMEDREAPDGLHHDHDSAQATCMPEHQLDSRNAWTGYRNLYHGQLDMQPDTNNQSLDCEDIYQSNTHGSPSGYDPTARMIEASLGSGFIDFDHRNDMCEEDPSYDPCFRHEYSTKTGMDWAASGIAETFERGDGHYDRLPEAGGASYLQADNFGNGETFNDGAGVSPKSEPPAFLGGRGFLKQGQDERFSSWTPHRRTTTQDSVLNLSTRSETVDPEAVDPAPLTGFWKPHKLY